MIARVAVPVPVRKLFDYVVPEKFISAISRGVRVKVPFGRRKMTGYCVETLEESNLPAASLKYVEDVVDEEPLIDEHLLALTRWIADKYLCSWGETLEAALPASVRKRGMSGREKKEENLEEDTSGFTIEMTEEQQHALSSIVERVEAGKPDVILLEGITGSGKTEVYMRAIDHVISIGRKALVLVPEISLTPQTVERFKKRFKHIAVMHSKLTDTERYSQWKSIKEGRADVVIGVRSAVFAPLKNIGLIVIDEEHENTFKQNSPAPRYHARDVAIQRALMDKAVVLLCSATPSLEAYRLSATRLRLTQRVEGRQLPPVRVVDMREEARTRKKNVIFSRRLVEAVDTVTKEGGQVILFLNRRGFSTLIRCPRCGFTMRCSDCYITLTYHKSVDKALCHYCGRSFDAPDTCPDCGFAGIRYIGTGTEKVAEEASTVWPKLRIERLDSDAVRSNRKMQSILSDFNSGRIDVLVGTQMIAKGHDFPNVRLVGIVDADVILSFPDFRASERTFQLICQVAGRAGRGEHGGLVIVQTRNPTHYAIELAASYDLEGFMKKEAQTRQALRYPPYGCMIRMIVSGKDGRKTAEAAKKMRDSCRIPACLYVLGPVPAPLQRLHGKWRWHILLKGEEEANLRSIAEEMMSNKQSGVDVAVDVDPLTIM